MLKSGFHFWHMQSLSTTCRGNLADVLEKKLRTDFLFPTIDHFVLGLLSVLNIFREFLWPFYSKSVEEADCKAMLNDWGVIGQDINKVLEETPVTSLKS
ncbi:MAG: hypothetical protein QM743_04730 [Chitinophagaceae bacterium]